MNNALFASSFAPPDPSPSVAPQPLCPSDVPLVLLPVRLETRFFTLSGNVTELRVRVFPDRIHVDTHHPELTTDERTWGTRYWQQDWSAGDDMNARADAWATLADRFGPERAAWIARVLTPTNVAQRPAGAPQFPTLPPVGANGESAWRHPPRARLLPDRWTAIVHSGGRAALSVTGKDIRRPLNVGPDPAAPPPDAATEAAIRAGDRLALDPDMLWMVDFDAAESCGMALRLRIPAEMLAAGGIDSLVVFGVSGTLAAAAAATQLADLLDAHHHTDGLELLRYGTPTNNTDDRRTAYGAEDRAHARSFALEVTADPTQAPNAARLGAALGLPPARVARTLGRLGQAAQDHDLDFRSMATALWQVGWGYFLTNMIGDEAGLPVSSVDWARRHFLDHVRAGGPLPAIRCGAQPYGVLPVTSLDLWAPGAGESVAPQETWLRAFLVKARDRVWRPALAMVPRIGLRAPADPDGDLNDVMRADGVSYGIWQRSVLGRQLVEHLYALDAQGFAGVAAQQDAVAAKLLQLLELPTLPAQRPRVAHAFFSDRLLPLTAPLVQGGEISPWQPLQPNYIANLLGAPTIQSVIDARPSHDAVDHVTSLLELLLRHAMLREVATAAARLASPAKGPLPTLLRDLELVDLVDVPRVGFALQPPVQPTHWRRQLDAADVPGIPAGMTIRRYLEGLQSFGTPPVAALGEFRAALARLQTLDTESLQLLLQGTLDLSSHRLDAWITSFAAKRLSLMRATGVTGLRVGGYGWVENLRPAAAPTAVPTASLPVGETAQGETPLAYLARDTGFIHAPSLAHASAAALLRNAHLGPTGTPEPDGPFAIDLSSRRAREAARLLDGVRAGQPLGALLGYHLERRLHELALDHCIAPLRNVAPLAVRQRADGDGTPDAHAAGNVVDGLLLLERSRDAGGDAGDDAIGDALAAAHATQTDIDLVSGELAAIADSVDALGDALTAEAAFQMVRGNTARLASTLAAIAHGDAVPPELEVARMPRTGSSLTHRTLVLIGARVTTGTGWRYTTMRSTRERTLAAWLRSLLGDATRVRCTVERVDDAGAVVETARFALNDVGLSPLDFVYWARPAGQGGGDDGDAATSPVEQLVLYHARRRAGGFGAAETLRLQHARPTDLAAGELTLFDLLEEARAVRRLLENARGLRPEDLTPPERGSQATIDLVELESRVRHYEDGLNAAHLALARLVARVATTPAESFRAGLLALGAYNVGPFVPNVAVGEGAPIAAALAAQAAAVLKTSRQRMDRVLSLRAQTAAPDPRARCDQLLARARAVHGDEFVCLPTLTCDAASGAELDAALAASTAQQGGDPLAVHGWFARASRVRDPLARLGEVLQTAEVLAGGTRLNLAVAQLPFDAAERWVGLPPAAGKALPPNKLSLVVQSTGAIRATQPFAGLLVDEWTEVVPNGEESTAIAFQYDPPNAMAPQSVLVAVPPVPGQDWTTETLRRVLMETLDLAKLRAVDPSLLGAAAQYLPALYVPFNAQDDAVSTDFAPMTVVTQPALQWDNGGMVVAMATPVANATLGRALRVSGSIEEFAGTIGAVHVQFGVGGPTVQATVTGSAWAWEGLVPNGIRPGQTFQLIAESTGTVMLPGTPPQPSPVSGRAVAEVTLENVVPTLTVDPLPSPARVTRAPLAATLSGSVSEGAGSAAPYGTPRVQVRVGPGPAATVPVAQGRWSVPLSLPLGDSIVTVQASDAFGTVTTVQRTITVVAR